MKTLATARGPVHGQIHLRKEEVLAILHGLPPREAYATLTAHVVRRLLQNEFNQAFGTNKTHVANTMVAEAAHMHPQTVGKAQQRLRMLGIVRTPTMRTTPRLARPVRQRYEQLHLLPAHA
jgi:hypothetical protein